MNIMKRIFILVFLISTITVHSGGLIKKLTEGESQQQLFIGVIEEKGKQLDDLQQELADLKANDEKFIEDIKIRIEEIKNIILATESDLKDTPDDGFLDKKITILKETYQVLKETQRGRENLVSLIDNFVKKLKKYLDDPDFTTFEKEYKLQERLHYSFENLQQLHEHILDQERLIKQLSDQEKNAQTEQESRKRIANETKEEYAQRKKELETFEEAGFEDFGFGLEPAKEQELLHIEEQLYKNKQRLNEFRMHEIEHKISFIQLQVFVSKSHLDLFKQHLRIIKPAIRISEADVAFAKDDLAKKRSQYYSQKEALQQDHEKISILLKRMKNELKQMSKQLNVPLGREIDEWSKEPKQTMVSYISLSQIGAANVQVKTLSKERDLIDAQIASEDEKFNYENLRVKAKDTYYKIVGRKFVTEEDITQERKKYDTKKENAKAALLLYQEKINNVANLLNSQKKVLDNIRHLYDNATEKKNTIFRGAAREYTRFVTIIKRAQDQVKKQIDILGKLTGVYSGITSEINRIVRLIDFIISELQAGTIWYRPEYAITWQGVKNIIPDAMVFLNDVRAYILQFNTTMIFERIKGTFDTPINWIYFVLRILTFVILLLLVKKNEVRITRFLFERGKEYGGLIRIMGFLIETIIRFVALHVFSIGLWISLLLLFQMIRDPYLDILFYLLSIPYLVYLSQRFVKSIISLNVKHDYVLLPEDFQRRFELVVSALIYITTTRIFFVQAFRLFMMTTYYRSELPTILLAVNFIIFQIALIFLITKEQILNVIPNRTDLWKWIRVQVDQYYYLILLVVVTIIVMSNPYVGFGRLVLYLLSGLLYSVLLVKGLLWIHSLFKRGISYVFFTAEDPIVRERFLYAKTWFGLSIIGSFIVLIFIGVAVGAKIWGWPITLDDMITMFKDPLILKGTKSPISMFSILQIILFIFSGFVTAYALNQFVLAKIFDLLLVDTGVQHTVTRIIQYLVITIAVFIGLNNVGLGALVGYLFTALAFSIGWYIKEPIGDFFAYFIILVQRPIKIGDFVQIDPETKGVVRKITARSVIIRRKNSTTIIVPNSYVISRAVENWNYVRNFIAINDINLFIPYKENPLQIKEIFLNVLEEHQNILKNPKPIIRLDDFGEYGFQFMIRGFISSSYTLEMWNIASNLRLSIIKALRDKNIEIAVPVRRIVDVHSHEHQHGHQFVDPHRKNVKE